MPKLGEIRERSFGRVRASARGGVGSTKTDSQFVDIALGPGERLRDIRYVIYDKKGDAGPGSVEQTPIINEVINIDSLRTRIKGMAEGQYIEAYAKGELDLELNIIQERINKTSQYPFQRYKQWFRAKGHPIGAANNNSYIEAEVFATIEYVGAPSDEEEIAREIVSKLAFTGGQKTISLLPDRWGYRCCCHRIEYFTRQYRDYLANEVRIADYYVRANDRDKKFSQPSFYYDMGGFTEGTIVRFKPALRSETNVSDRKVQVVIWELGDDIKVNSVTSRLPLGTSWQTFEVSHTKQRRNSIIRLEVYWHDNIESDIILNEGATIVTIEK
ncbi:hypothetical protein B4083_0878 [Bacillus cereus]|nr:hypothetical protein B4083_0878 [Bacillus cereus]